jgi:hypothetical protein
MKVIGALGLFLLIKNKPKAPITLIGRIAASMAIS